jgi:acetyltransferase-like isoleucine patch superfamily enzyme
MEKFISQLFIHWRKMSRHIRMALLRPSFKRYGKNFTFDPDSLFTYSTIEVGNDVYIGPKAILTASKSAIIIGNKVMFGPRVTIIGGNHNASVVGTYMFDVKEKRPEDDLPIIIEDDVWVGAGAIILKGVTLHRGSIVAAGAVVTKDVPAYSIVGGVPARVISTRFTVEEIQQHEELLYPPEKRLPPDAVTKLS